MTNNCAQNDDCEDIFIAHKCRKISLIQIQTYGIIFLHDIRKNGGDVEHSIQSHINIVISSTSTRFWHHNVY